MSRFATVPAVLDELRHGRMVVVWGGDGGASEADLVAPARLITAETINFMARYARGLICLALEASRCEELGLDQMPSSSDRAGARALMVTIEAAHGVTTGISAADRARTIAVASDPGSGREDLRRPGHVVPLRASQGGVLDQAGHAEAAVELARLAGVGPAAVLCAILRRDGAMARLADLEGFCERHRLKVVAVADLISYIDRGRLGRDDPAPHPAR